MSRSLLHRLWLAVGAIVLIAVFPQAQNISSAKETALRFLQGTPTQFNLTREDVSDVRITDAYVSKHNGLTHVWVQQQYAGIPVYNALFGLHVRPDGSVLQSRPRFCAGFGQKCEYHPAIFGCIPGARTGYGQSWLYRLQNAGVKRKINEQNWVFESGAVSRAEIPVTICYALNEKKRPRLAWKITIDQANSS
jgi:extracellular elastinolytic metalloproteinase